MKKDLGPVLHLTGGVMVGVLAIFGVGREFLQHPEDLHLSLHQWIEALAWPAGGLLAIGAGIPLVKWIIRRRRS